VTDTSGWSSDNNSTDQLSEMMRLEYGLRSLSRHARMQRTRDIETRRKSGFVRAEVSIARTAATTSAHRGDCPKVASARVQDDGSGLGHGKRRRIVADTSERVGVAD
jgi:hypothetical protein